MTPAVAATVAGVALVYLALVATLWFFQERVVFQPPAPSSTANSSARRVAYRANDGIELFGYVIGECRAGMPLVLAFHGNADLSVRLLPWALQLSREADACVMIPEYRGYDGLAGAPTYVGAARDARAALAFARDELQAGDTQLVYFGHSLGTAIAAELSASDPPAVLILQSPFTSARAMARRLFVPGLTLFWRIISRVHFDTIARVRALAVPVWVSHGDRDAIIPAWMGRDVFGAARNPGELLIVAGAAHNNVPEIGGRAYWTWLTRAVQSGHRSAASLGAPAGTRSAP